MAGISRKVKVRCMGIRLNDENDETKDRSLSLRHILEHCWDFANEKTALQELVESRGHILRMGVKGHPEMAGMR